MTDDLIARLRDNIPTIYDCMDAADALEAKDRRIAELRKEADMMHSEYKTAAARIAALEAALMKQREHARWNIDFDGDDLLICDGDHDKGDKCDYTRYCLVSKRDARIAELEAALKPFADMNCQTTDKPGLYSCIVTHKMMADAARAALASSHPSDATKSFAGEKE